VAAVGAEQNVGKLHTICEDLGKREVEAWLQEHQKADAAIKQKVRDADKFFEDLRARFADPSGKQVPHGLQPSDKCEHGMYVPEFYCYDCRDGRENEPAYRADVYGPVLHKALARARRVLCVTSDGREYFKNLQQDCIVEICRASKKPGKEMNAKLAYKNRQGNVASEFLKQRIEENYHPPH